MRLIKRAFWHLLQLAAVGYFFVIGGALLQWPFTITYEEAKVRFGDQIQKECRAFVVTGKSINKSHPYYCQPLVSIFYGYEGMFILVWSFIGNIFILYASAKPSRGFKWGENSNLTLG